MVIQVEDVEAGGKGILARGRRPVRREDAGHRRDRDHPLAHDRRPGGGGDQALHRRRARATCPTSAAGWRGAPTGLSDPGFLWLNGYVSGTERILVSQFDVPTSMEGGAVHRDRQGGTTSTRWTTRACSTLTGTVGTLLKADTPGGPDRAAGRPTGRQAGRAVQPVPLCEAADHHRAAVQPQPQRARQELRHHQRDRCRTPTPSS